METKVTQTVSRAQMAKLLRLKRRLKRSGVSQEAVAHAVRPRKVTRPMVNNVLHGRAQSSRVIAAAERLIARKNGRRRT